MTIRRIIAIAVLGLAAPCLFAIQSPLRRPDSYLYAPLSESNGTSIIKGEIIGRNIDYGMMRAEDFAFFDEAFKERAALALSSPAPSTNVVKSLRFSPRASSGFIFTKPGTRSRFYMQPEPALENGFYIPPLGEEYERTVIPPSTNFTNSVSMVTNWFVAGTNTFRADWPSIVTAGVHSVTNSFWISTPTNVTETRSFKDCLMKTDGDFVVASNIFDEANLTLSSPIPALHEITNLNTIIGRARRLYAEAPSAKPIEDTKTYVILNETRDSFYADTEGGDYSVHTDYFEATNWSVSSISPSGFSFFKEEAAYIETVFNWWFEEDDRVVASSGTMYSSAEERFEPTMSFDVEYSLPTGILPADDYRHIVSARVFELWNLSNSGYTIEDNGPAIPYYISTNGIYAAPGQVSVTGGVVVVSFVRDLGKIADGFGGATDLLASPGDTIDLSGLEMPSAPELEDPDEIPPDATRDDFILSRGTLHYCRATLSIASTVIVFTCNFRTVSR